MIECEGEKKKRCETSSSGTLSSGVLAMGKQGLYSGPAGGRKPKAAGQKKTKNAASSLAHLQQVKKASRAKYSHAQSTQGNYAGYIKRGKAFLAKLVSERQDSAEKGGDDGICAETEEGDDGKPIDWELLAKAFDNPPNKYSVMALELFIVEKCLTENHGTSTSGGIQGAFTTYWDNM